MNTAKWSDEAWQAALPTYNAILELPFVRELAAKASPEVRRRMTDIFVMATKMEWMFWESAYRLEKWAI